ncbi:MAG: hypothetical protein ACJ762_12230 [Solirubrobacteraceae bacterium]
MRRSRHALLAALAAVCLAGLPACNKSDAEREAGKAGNKVEKAGNKAERKAKEAKRKADQKANGY